MKSPVFVSKREKRLWITILLVVAGIYSSLAFTPSILEALPDQQAAIGFLLSMFLMLLMVLVQALRKKRSQLELGVLFGVIAVYIMFIMRMSLPERTHLIEYSVVGALVFEALRERMQAENKTVVPFLLAILISTLIGVIDECIQYFLPNRVFDFIDILFNFLSALASIIAMAFLGWVRKRSNL